MTLSIFRPVVILGLFTLGLSACVGEAIDPNEVGEAIDADANEEEIGEAESALCPIDDPCPPSPPSSKPNLTVVPPPFQTCGLVDPYTAKVTVTNIGAAWARATTTRLMFLTDHYYYHYWEVLW